MVNDTEEIRKAHDKAIEDTIEIATRLAKVNNELENTKIALDIVTEECLQAKEELEDAELRELNLKQDLKTKETLLAEAYKIIQTLNETNTSTKESLNKLEAKHNSLKSRLINLTFFDRVFIFKDFIKENIYNNGDN